MTPGARLLCSLGLAAAAALAGRSLAPGGAVADLFAQGAALRQALNQLRSAPQTWRRASETRWR